MEHHDRDQDDWEWERRSSDTDSGRESPTSDDASSPRPTQSLALAMRFFPRQPLLSAANRFVLCLPPGPFPLGLPIPMNLQELNARRVQFVECDLHRYHLLARQIFTGAPIEGEAFRSLQERMRRLRALLLRADDADLVWGLALVLEKGFCSTPYLFFLPSRFCVGG
jgi:hypothetical protein